jgi:capsular exopolysaccharide synthesis family protein
MSEAMGAPALGFVTRDKETAAHGLVARDSHSRAAEGFRQLRNELQLLNSGDSPRTIMVASAVPGAGTSTVVANLAATLAAAGKAVAVVDADLRRPALASVFGMADEPGLTDVISGDADVAAALQRTQGGRLAVLASGTGAEIPDEVLASEKMALLLRTLRAEHDVVLIDAPALLPVADAGVLAARVDGVVLCVRYGKTTVDQVRMSRHILDRVGGHTLGAVMNVVPRRVIKRWGARPYRMTSGRTRTATAPLPETQPAERRTAAAR